MNDEARTDVPAETRPPAPTAASTPVTAGAPAEPDPRPDAEPDAWIPAERSERITNFVLACIAITVLSVAVYLHPSPEGHGTHQQLGLPPCNFLQATGYPCLSCGMTTSFSHAVRGQFIASFIAQPFGMLLAIGTMLSVPLLLWSSIRGWSLSDRLARVNWRFWGPVLLTLLIGAWVYKILQIRLAG